MYQVVGSKMIMLHLIKILYIFSKFHKDVASFESTTSSSFLREKKVSFDADYTSDPIMYFPWEQTMKTKTTAQQCW